MMEFSLLQGWDNFYVIVGSSAAGLTGLTFIVITLAADAHRVSPNGLRIFITPTIVHFAAVLGAAAFVLLMIAGIHNAWDIAVWNSLSRQDDTPNHSST
jgi:hypothetical protein